MIQGVEVGVGMHILTAADREGKGEFWLLLRLEV